MTSATGHCADLRRRLDIRWRGLNGLDYVEVSDDQLVLTVYFLGKAPEGLGRVHVRIAGGVQIRDIEVRDVRLCSHDDPATDDCMKVFVSRPGDFSTYMLRVVAVDEREQPRGTYPGFDPRYAAIPFSFKQGCPSDLDCHRPPVCPEPVSASPAISYLAKDYASFRQLMLDRMAVTLPSWREHHVPDIGIALVEVLAYAADHLSYYQDAVGTEAYLGTARQRQSVRRHARLVDYQMHEGCNARAWVCVRTSADTIEDLSPNRILFVTRLPGEPPGSPRALTFDQLQRFQPEQYQVFEPMDRSAPIRLHVAHNEIHFYTWGDLLCCLPQGATSASLRDRWDGFDEADAEPAPEADAPKTRGPRQRKMSARQDAPKADAAQPAKTKGKREPAQEQKSAGSPPAAPEPRRALRNLREGDVLIFEEIRGPVTGAQADADPVRRHAVRLTRVERDEDALYPWPEGDPYGTAANGDTPPDERLKGRGVPVVHIEWHQADALPFPLCLSALVPAGPDGTCESRAISVARGNVVLVDHGSTTHQSLGVVGVDYALQPCEEEGRPQRRVPVPVQFTASLERRPLTMATDYAPDGPASSTVSASQDPRKARPVIAVDAIPPAPDGSGPLFSPRDLGDPLLVAGRLKAQGDPSAVYVRAALEARHQEAIDAAGEPAALAESTREAVLEELRQLLERWSARPDLLASGPDDPHFVVEIDDEGDAHVRFGDDDLGRGPAAGTAFLATYRTGSGLAGNVGAEAIAHIVTRGLALDGLELQPRNPLPAAGGQSPELIDDTKMLAPMASRHDLARAITADDYAELARRRHPSVQGAAAALHWTGSGYQVTVAIDERGRAEAGAELLERIAGDLAGFRRIGHSVTVVAARQVPLDIELRVCLKPSYVQGHVKAALLDVFSNRVRPDGRKGFFHPDTLTFGTSIYLSALVAAAQRVDGVESVSVTRLQRRFEDADGELERGVLTLRPFEVARVDNDPAFPERGRIAFDLRGGR